MPRKVRKQIYIEERQDRQLRRIAETRGVSQAHLIRRAIDQESAAASQSLVVDPAAWQEALEFIKSLHRSATGRAPRRWTRDELYADRLERNDDRAD